MAVSLFTSAISFFNALFFFLSVLLITTKSCSRYFELMCYTYENLQHKIGQVNFKLWEEAQEYGDIQLMPFVDYYSLLTLKTIAICILGVSMFASSQRKILLWQQYIRVHTVIGVQIFRLKSSLLNIS